MLPKLFMFIQLQKKEFLNLTHSIPKKVHLRNYVNTNFSMVKKSIKFYGKEEGHIPTVE